MRILAYTAHLQAKMRGVCWCKYCANAAEYYVVQAPHNATNGPLCETHAIAFIVRQLAKLDGGIEILPTELQRLFMQFFAAVRQHQSSFANF